MRIFLAVLFQDKIINQIHSIKDEIESLGIDGHYTRDDLLHMTLHYIGELSEKKLMAVKKSLEEINMKSFLVQTQGLKYFGQETRHKLLYIGVNLNRKLDLLHEVIIEKLDAAGIQVNHQRYIPHITLVRHVKASIEDVIKLKIESLQVNIKGIHIMESKRLDGRLVYEPLFFIPLVS